MALDISGSDLSNAEEEVPWPKMVHMEEDKEDKDDAIPKTKVQGISPLASYMAQIPKVLTFGFLSLLILSVPGWLFAIWCWQTRSTIVRQNVLIYRSGPYVTVRYLLWFYLYIFSFRRTSVEDVLAFGRISIEDIHGFGRTSVEDVHLLRRIDEHL